MVRFLILCLLTILISCANSDNDQHNQYSGPLIEFFVFWDELNTQTYRLDTYERAYMQAVGQNNQEAILTAENNFSDVHTRIISEIERKYPSGSLKLPFEQANDNQVRIETIYISSYEFPWSFATRLSYRVSFDCIVRSDLPVSMVRFEFFDRDGDIIMSSNMPVYHSGKYTFEIRPEIEFFHFERILIIVS